MLMANISFRISKAIFSPIIALQLTDVNMTKSKVNQRLGLNILNISMTTEEIISPNDCDIMKLTKKVLFGFVKVNTSAIAVHINMMMK